MPPRRLPASRVLPFSIFPSFSNLYIPWSPSSTPRSRSLSVASVSFPPCSIPFSLRRRGQIPHSFLLIGSCAFPVNWFALTHSSPIPSHHHLSCCSLFSSPSLPCSPFLLSLDFPIRGVKISSIFQSLCSSVPRDP